MDHLDRIASDPALIALELEVCRRSCDHWMDNWCWTYDPRNVGIKDSSTWLPFDRWAKQREFTRWLDDCFERREDGLVEKSRDSGFTWLCAAYAIHKWRFVPGFDIAFGSRKQELVDKLGDPKSIFEKIRTLMRRLPAWMLPEGFDSRQHVNFLRIINPENGNSITGEAGDEMGRGGRVAMYFVDEADFIERPDSVEGATSATTNCRIWGSTVGGIGSFMYRKKHGGSFEPRQIFEFDVTDDPRKTPEVIAELKRKNEPHIYAREYGRDYAAAVEGICIPGTWVQAAQQIAAELAKQGITVQPAPRGVAGLDVGGGGRAKSVCVARFGPIVCAPVSRNEVDTNEVAAWALDYAEAQQPMRGDEVCRVTLANYDSVGVGHGCLGVMTRGRRGLVAHGINTGIKPTERSWPDGETSQEKFGNLKAELWFLARERYKRTHEMLMWLRGEKDGIEHPLSDIVVMPVGRGDILTLAAQLSIPKWFRNEVGKIVIETKKQLQMRNIPSPDHADAFVLTMVEDDVLATWRAAFGGAMKGARR